MIAPKGYWVGRKPCWEILECGRYVRETCAAWIHPEKACWEHESSQCAVVLGLPKTCGSCKVFRRYGSGKDEVVGQSDGGKA